MMDIMHTCWNWMMSFGALGILVGVVVLVLFIAMFVALIRQLRSPRQMK